MGRHPLNAMLIGIAGKTGAGKNEVAAILEKHGFRTLDLDIVGHRALDFFAEKIEKDLGPGLLVKGKINRRELAERVFKNPKKLHHLEQITYPWIEQETRRWINDDKSRHSAIHAINLHKTTLPESCRAILWIKTSRWRQHQRLARRDGQTINEVKRRFQSQKKLNPKLFSSQAEIYIVKNSRKKTHLENSLIKILERLHSSKEVFK